MDTILIVPGLNDSCARHWQSWFESCLPNCVRVTQPDWQGADLPSWGRTLHSAAARAGASAWIVAHSFGCLAVAHAAAQIENYVAGALLVAPADPARFGASGLLPKTALFFKTMLIGSEKDPWMSLERAQSWAEAWRATFVNADQSDISTSPRDMGHGRTACGCCATCRATPAAVSASQSAASLTGPCRSRRPSPLQEWEYR